MASVLDPVVTTPPLRASEFVTFTSPSSVIGAPVPISRFPSESAEAPPRCPEAPVSRTTPVGEPVTAPPNARSDPVVS